MLFIAVNLFIGCSSSALYTSNYAVLGEVDLPGVSKETSGLCCPEVASAYTVNDSSNSPIIYKVDKTGRVLTELVIATKNIDWEALTGD